MSRPLVEFGGGSGEIPRDLLHLRSVSEAEALISGAEGRDQLRHGSMSLQAPDPVAASRRWTPALPMDAKSAPTASIFLSIKIWTRDPVLDLMLPGTDGIELMASVPDLADRPVIFISGFGRDETYDTLLRQVWDGRSFNSLGPVRAYVKRLRRKLGDDADRLDDHQRADKVQPELPVEVGGG